MGLRRRREKAESERLIDLSPFLRSRLLDRTSTSLGTDPVHLGQTALWNQIECCDATGRPHTTLVSTTIQPRTAICRSLHARLGDSFCLLTLHSLFVKLVGVNHGLTIEWSIKAIRDMRRLSTLDRARIVTKIEQYAGDPESLGNQVITLTGGKYRRLRIGDHRVIFDVERGDTSTMIVLRIRHRREAYD